MKASGGNFRTLKKYVALEKVSVEHFTRSSPESRRSIRRRNGAKANRFCAERDLKEGTWIGSSRLKSHLFRLGLLKNMCSCCGISEWQGKQLVCQLDHINGISTDNRLENLRILCPNCHSQTDTFSGKNAKHDHMPV